MASTKLLMDTLKHMPVGRTITVPELEYRTGRYGSNLRRILDDLLELKIIKKINIDETGKKGSRLRVAYIRQI